MYHNPVPYFSQRHDMFIMRLDQPRQKFPGRRKSMRCGAIHQEKPVISVIASQRREPGKNSSQQDQELRTMQNRLCACHNCNSFNCVIQAIKSDFCGELKE